MERGNVEENDQQDPPAQDPPAQDPPPQDPPPQEPHLPVFIKKLLNFLEISTSGVRWSADGTSVIFGLDAESYFRDHYPSLKYRNVPRELQQFGFSKTGGGAVGPGEVAYKHDLFQRDLPELRSGIRRKQTKSAAAASSSSSSDSNVEMAVVEAVFDIDKKLDKLISLIAGKNLLSTDEPPCDTDIGNLELLVFLCGVRTKLEMAIRLSRQE
ncbi:hypothetical protein Pyn_12473 [Prunus yedoensis var. nudiflora]|uniref:HSF-type DNA-binding domain-containing protein n=1 Tax=Prunus yedoensis var. nudiflora TaxID=2094558 RepID=A0A314YFK2_PRUYE|nr:hypothetical protein Pyn_12473 [Prunus yedoensis var. nudiflora]